ncbi:hypothetical protein [Ancylobacter oerskovii]|uniref:Uncharacterized protein n=1 Tax=Ancylobacter oerskovii TaxID=459519 RepID=A0ABW4Z4Z3_9HYPH|nr:hypothetical protein [Ancylobacter oerskovii]MBS7545716.1 hypothetical protein [Ancylobacter oerskovii]
MTSQLERDVEFAVEVGRNKAQAAEARFAKLADATYGHGYDAKIAIELAEDILEGADLRQGGRMLADHEVDRVLWLLSKAHDAAQALTAPEMAVGDE